VMSERLSAVLAPTPSPNCPRWAQHLTAARIRRLLDPEGYTGAASALVERELGERPGGCP
jgi:hypothetical protein